MSVFGRFSDIVFSKESFFIKKLRGINLRTRLIAVFLLVAILPLFLFTVFSIQVYSNSLKTKLTQAAEQSTQMLTNNLSILLKNYGDAISELSLSADIQDALSSKELWTNDIGRNTLHRSIQKAAQSIYSSTAQIKDICVVDTEQNAIFKQGYVHLEPDVLSDIIAQTEQTSPHDHLYYVKTYSGEDVLALGRKIYDSNYSSTHKGYVIVFFSTSIVNDNILPVSVLGEGSSIILADRSGNIIAAQDRTLTGQSLENKSYYRQLIETQNSASDKVINMDAKGQIIIASFNKNYNVYMITTISSSVINAEIARVQRLVVSMAIPLIVLTILITMIICRSITAPVETIISVYGNDAAPDRQERVNDRSPDELGVLARTIDEMADKNQAMLAQISADDRLKRELELEMLQYQINPHFLFNTLNTLKWIATLNDVPVLSNGITSLSAILQHTLVQKDEFVTLETEINCLKDYCMIQSLRYAGKFSVDYYISDAVYLCLIPRFILQPLVENAILHGTNDDEPVNISVFAEEISGMLHVIIRDNGAGFCVDDVIDQKNGRFSGIGLSNVDTRLRLYYESSNGLSITSTPGHGTTCHIEIPVNFNPDRGDCYV